MTSPAVTTVEHLASALGLNGGPDAVVVLGAGASLKSGIPLSGPLAERAAKWAYCRSRGRHPDDPTILRSDWLPWLQQHPWYRTDRSAADNYSDVIERLLVPREDRRDFLLGVINPGVPASPGYERLADFMAQGIIRTVLTTNFDAVLPDLCRSRNRPHHVEIIKTPADYTKLSTVPAYPQLIYLHGSVEHYTDKNLLEEVQRLDEELVRQLVPMLRDHPLVVIGYRGGEPSVMRHLLIEQVAAANGFRHGIYWCAMRGSVPDGLHPHVRELADAVGGNLQIVPIDGFDEVMDQLRMLYELQPRSTSAPVGRCAAVSRPAPTFDMQPVCDASIDELDWPRLQTSLVEYCRRMDIRVPSPVDRDWLLARLHDLDLAVPEDGRPRLTVAGYLLFARHLTNRMRGARVVVRIAGEAERCFEGNLWSQLESVMAALDEVNRPFRLKGSTSETVFPYPTLAIKEVVVNALVHRSYEESQRVLVDVEPTYIRIANPGGLVDEVARQLGLPLQKGIARGSRGVKGYRNPVIADLFYGAGAMDKAGSGLADVQDWVRENESDVAFGPIRGNTAFEVTLFRRPETPDAATGVATPLVTRGRYISNLLEIIELPSVVWHASTAARRTEDIWRATGADKLPPFIPHNRRLFTFADLTDESNPLHGQVDSGDAEELSLAEFAVGQDGERLLVRLLNQALYRHLDALDLVVDRKRQRAYFPRTDTGPREMTYQARLRRATRTVTKPVISRTTQKVRYWEHEAIRFGFEPYGETWSLQIVPGYAFTLNGWRRLLEGPQVTRLATRRASRDYNLQVYNDLVFWTWVLAGGEDAFTLDTGGEVGITVRAQLAAREVRDAPPPDAAELDVLEDVQISDLEDELGRLADAAITDEFGEFDGTEA